jgi:hypothetical protein
LVPLIDFDNLSVQVVFIFVYFCSLFLLTPRFSIFSFTYSEISLSVKLLPFEISTFLLDLYDFHGFYSKWQYWSALFLRFGLYILVF